MSTISEALKALVNGALDGKIRYSMAAETWIETAEKILKYCPGKGKAREKPLVCLEISGLLTGDKFVTREQYVSVSGLNGKLYLQSLRATWTKISSLNEAGLPRLTVQLVAKAMGAEDLIPWAESLIFTYETEKKISRDEQPSCIIAAFELVKPAAKETFPADLKLIREIKASMADNVKEIKKDVKYNEALSKSASLRKSSRLSATFSADSFSIEIEPSRSSSPQSEPEPPAKSTKRTYILPTSPFYETKSFKMLLSRINV